jgi:hypothetical protein
MAGHKGIQKLLNSGAKDGDPNDEKVKIFERSLPAKSLRPTQCEIGISDYFKSNKRRISSIIKGNTSFLNKDRVLVALLDEKYYIIDGHHRWCKVFLFNPDANVPCILMNFEKLGYKDPEDVLKIVQLAVASTYRKLVTQKETDPLNALDKIKRGKLEKVMSKPFIDFLRREWNLDSDDKVIDQLLENLEKIENKKPKERIDRIFMPQPKETADKVGNDKNTLGEPNKFIKKLKSGDLDFRDIKESYIKNFDNFKY